MKQYVRNIKPISYVPKGYLAVRMVTDSDANIFKSTKVMVAKLLIDDYTDEDRLDKHIKRKYVIVDLGNSVIIYKGKIERKKVK